MDENQPSILSPNVSPPSPIFPITPAKSPFGLIIKIIIGVIVVAIVGTGVALGTRVWDPLWSPFRPDPEKVIKETINKTSELKSLHSNISFTAAVESEKEKASFSGKIEGDFALTSSSDFNFDESFEFKLATQSPSSPLVPGVQIALAGNLKKIGDTKYFKINSFPAVFFAFLPPQIKTLENKWIKIDLESYKKIMEKTTEEVQLWEAYLAVPLDEMMEESKDFQKELGEKIKNILKDKQFYSMEKEFPDEKIEGKKAYHYKVSLILRPAEIGEIIAGTFRAIQEEMLIVFGSAPAYPNSAEIKKKVEEVFNKIGAVSAEIWIGKKDGYIYKIKIKFDKEIDLAQLVKAGNSKALIELNLEANYSKFGQTVEIKPPGEFKAIEDMLIPLIEESIKDGAIKSNLFIYIRAQMNRYFYQRKTYYGITCKSPLINSYCAEIKKITGKDPIIRASKNNYCVYSELFSKEDGKTKYYCVSNSNSYPTGESTTDPGLKGYCDGKTFICPPLIQTSTPLWPIY